MTKYSVVQKFKDKETGKIYDIGDSYPANSKKARIKELLDDDHEGRDSRLSGKAIISEIEDTSNTPKTKKATKKEVKADDDTTRD
ncbi:hypothetical protein HB837_15855 [Listeria innocua]|uniref:hypothetical protein n=1 Tax=Listeria innocua TaxID=1642 RepID=UPI00162A3051|nr:hypothetical protein [Listeria innocua]MBC1353881.1 hypothetical protein [Listeria innocua]